MNMDEYCDSEEHIYENIVSSTSRYKYNKILYGFINSFSLKKRDKIPTPPPLIHRSASDEGNKNIDNNTDMTSCEFYENSYTSCEDDNIYENLEFFDAYDDDNFVHIDCALDDWMRNLAYDIDDYETENYIFVKSIPSVLQQTNYMISHRNQHVSKSEITLNFLKSLWREDRVGMMSFLLETFSSLLRIQSQNVTIPINVGENSKASEHSRDMEVTENSPKKFTRLKRRRRDIYRKLILSSSLNSMMITYNKSLKFYFSLSLCEAYRSRQQPLSNGIIIYLIKKSFKFKFNSKREKREFYEALKIIFLNENHVITRRKLTNQEIIYQPLWTCQSSTNTTTNKRSAMMINENIYAQLMTPMDDSEWEIDDEFSFVLNASDAILMNKIMTTEKLSLPTAQQPSAFRSVLILYSENNSEFNKIIYDRESFKRSLSNNSNSLSSASELASCGEHKTVDNKNIENLSGEKMKIDEKYLAPVEAWKIQIQSPSYMEDEDDILIHEEILNTNFFFSTSNLNSNESLESDQQSKSIYDDAKSFQFDENQSINKSIDSFRSANLVDGEVESFSEKSPSLSPRHRLRDKIASKFRLKSSRTVNISDHSLNDSVKSTNDDDENERHKIFGCNLELVEKDGYYKEIPKFIVECVKYLEIDSNLKTAGIYRISGNKTLMDNLRKKLNEKRSPKKDSKYLCLQEQDVHTLTGLLKMFFRELHPPLMPKAIFDACTSDKLSASQMREKLTEMPALNYALLKYLFKHFKSIERYEKDNLMSSGNIAICWGLGLFASKDELNPFDNDIAKCNLLCKFLIDNFREVFES